MRMTTMYTTQPKFSTTTMLMVCLAVISMCVHQGHSFTTAPITTQRQKSSLSMMLGPDIEAQVLTTMAHVTMDFPGMMKQKKTETPPTMTTELAARGPSKTVVLPFLLVVGRVMVIASDYILDHSIHPEELMIQLFLMSASMKDILLILTTNNSN